MTPIRLNAKRGNKFGAKKVRIDGHLFDSKAEAKHYGELKILEMAGEISEIRVHPVFKIEINGIAVCKVILDFSYLDVNGRDVHVDVKGNDTALSRLKRRMVEAAYSINVVLVRCRR